MDNINIPVETAPVPQEETGTADETLDLSDEFGTTGDIVAVVEEPPRLFLSTPFSDYTVTEGLLLCVLLALIVSALWSFVKEAF